jgi:hypothetical protein
MHTLFFNSAKIMMRAILFILCILILPNLGCNSNKSESLTKVGKFTFSLPKGDRIQYDDSDSTEGKIVFVQGFTANFARGYFNPLAYSKIPGDILYNDTIKNDIIVITSQTNVSEYSVLYYAWDTLTMTTLILKEKRYEGIIFSATNLDKNQKTKFLEFIESITPNN